MRLVYHNDWRGNFGDDLNIPFFEHILPEYKSVLRDKSLYGIGTLLNNVHGDIKNSIILGSGFGYGDSVSIDWSTTKVFGVRGPLTAKKLGLDPNQYVIGDPAMYLKNMPCFMTGPSYGYKRVVALHHKSAELWDFSKNNDTGLFFLDPGMCDIQSYISIIRGADMVYAESLHGAIIAATFGIPFTPISIKTSLEKKKWDDFYASIGVEPAKPYNALKPQLSLVRRLLVSSKGRKVINTNKNGPELLPSYFTEFNKNLVTEKIDKNSVIADQAVIEKLQGNIANAIEAFVLHARS
jgi:succinoglycan biosynthesis protein ExoV